MNKKVLLLGLMLAVAAVMVGLRDNNVLFAANGEKISAEQGKAQVAQGALLIDARTPREFARSHVPGAVNIPFDQVAIRIKEFGPDKNKTVIFYCRSGNRSGKATKTLRKLGWPNAFNGGGLKQWQ